MSTKKKYEHIFTLNRGYCLIVGPRSNLLSFEIILQIEYTFLTSFPQTSVERVLQFFSLHQMIKCLITAHTSWYSPKGVRYCRISLCCMPRVRGEREKDIGTMWYPPLGAQITFPVERKPLLVLINNGCFACRQLLPETKRKYLLILGNWAGLCRANLLGVLPSWHPPPHPTPPPPLDTKEEKQMIISTNTEVLEEGHFSIYVIVTT